jgi:uncharacterized protein
MIDFIYRLAIESWQITLILSPSLLLGLLLAGLLHLLLPKNFIQRHLSGSGLGQVVKATVLGVPMPLCSCGVIPTALGLRRDGASKGAATSFLISTPQTGMDSILVSAGFLGWPFAIFKVIVAFMAGIFGGLAVNVLDTLDNSSKKEISSSNHKDSGGSALRRLWDYAVWELLAAIAGWLIVGIFISAFISVLIPPGYLAQQSWAQGIVGMLLMLAISLPLYVCTTGSVPIAASLIAAGLPLGSALVFLIAGPATNVATIGAIYRSLGMRVLLIYQGTVIIFSLLAGLFFESLLAGFSAPEMHIHHESASWLSLGSAFLFLLLLAYVYLASYFLKGKSASLPTKSGAIHLKVKGMTCAHCVANAKKALENLESVQTASPDLLKGEIELWGEANDTELKESLQAAGYTVTEIQRTQK